MNNGRKPVSAGMRRAQYKAEQQSTGSKKVTCPRRLRLAEVATRRRETTTARRAICESRTVGGSDETDKRQLAVMVLRKSTGGVIPLPEEQEGERLSKLRGGNEEKTIEREQCRGIQRQAANKMA